MTTIDIRHAHEHNLDGLDLSIPRQALTVLTGPSGSGKSSLAIDTLYTEGQRRLVEALGGSRGHRLRRPDVALITGLPPTIGVLRDASRSPRTTFGDVIEVLSLLRSLTVHAGIRHCPRCDTPLPVTRADAIVATLADLPAGERLTIYAPIPYTGAPDRVLDEIHHQGFARVRIDGTPHRIEDVPTLSGTPAIDVIIDRIRIRPGIRTRLDEAIQLGLAAGGGRVMVAQGSDRTLRFADHPYCFTDDLAFPPASVQQLSPNAAVGSCSSCEGLGCGDCSETGLQPTARHLRLGPHAFPQWLDHPSSEIVGWLTELAVHPRVAPLRAELLRRLDLVLHLGLGHLPLGRRAPGLSTGEYRRARLIGQTSHALSGVFFVIDEPSAGLHPRDIPALSAYLQRLRDAGNTVLVVDHHPALLAIADHQLQLGPGAGPEGGKLLYAGPPRPVPLSRLPTVHATPLPASTIRLTGAQGQNLKDVTLHLPRGVWTGVFGVSGSGKSALITHTLVPALLRLQGRTAEPLPYAGLEGAAGLTRLIQLDQVGPSRSWRSCTATATGIWSPIRALLAQTRTARIRGYGPERFSFNRPGGRCETCQGAGVVRLRLETLPETSVICDACAGRRFDEATRAVEYRGASVDTILQMSVTAARQHFANHPRIARVLVALTDVGLGYLPLGQTADSFSGGEAQRVRLAAELARVGGATSLQDTVVILDEPTSALHPQDVQPIQDALRRLVSRGATLVTVGADPALLHAADWLIEMGTGPGSAGGLIISAGTAQPKITQKPD